MRVWKLGVLLIASLAGITAVVSQEQTQADKDAIEAVRALAQKIENCPATEQVAEFKKKWVKVAWGPPRDVKFDVERSASLVAPYKGTITFLVPYSGGDHRKTREEAQQDKNLNVIFVSPVQYTLRVSANASPKIESMQIKNSLADTWSQYSPVSPERFCWITVVQ